MRVSDLFRLSSLRFDDCIWTNLTVVVGFFPNSVQACEAGQGMQAGRFLRCAHRCEAECVGLDFLVSFRTLVPRL